MAGLVSLLAAGLTYASLSSDPKAMMDVLQKEDQLAPLIQFAKSSSAPPFAIDFLFEVAEGKIMPPFIKTKSQYDQTRAFIVDALSPEFLQRIVDTLPSLLVVHSKSQFVMDFAIANIFKENQTVLPERVWESLAIAMHKPLPKDQWVHMSHILETQKVWPEVFQQAFLHLLESNTSEKNQNMAFDLFWTASTGRIKLNPEVQRAFLNGLNSPIAAVQTRTIQILVSTEYEWNDVIKSEIIALLHKTKADGTTSHARNNIERLFTGYLPLQTTQNWSDNLYEAVSDYLGTVESRSFKKHLDRMINNVDNHRIAECSGEMDKYK